MPTEQLTLTDKYSIHVQILEWVNGKSLHNTVRDECCPDFSCCRPELLWPLEMRKKYATSGDHVKAGMLDMANTSLALNQPMVGRDGTEE